MAMIVIRGSFFVIREGGAPGAPFLYGEMVEDGITGEG